MVTLYSVIEIKGQGKTSLRVMIGTSMEGEDTYIARHVEKARESQRWQLSNEWSKTLVVSYSMTCWESKRRSVYFQWYNVTRHVGRNKKLKVNYDRACSKDCTQY